MIAYLVRVVQEERYFLVRKATAIRETALNLVHVVVEK